MPDQLINQTVMKMSEVRSPTITNCLQYIVSCIWISGSNLHVGYILYQRLKQRQIPVQFPLNSKVGLKAGPDRIWAIFCRYMESVFCWIRCRPGYKWATLNGLSEIAPASLTEKRFTTI